MPALLALLTCGALGLMEPTETRYAEIAREMLASGDWLTPRLNGISHFHKPPLTYWATAGGMALLGVNEWGARLAVALAAALMLWGTAALAGKTGGTRHAGEGLRRAAPTASLAPLLLASTLLFFVLTRQLASDVFLGAAVVGFWAALLSRRRRDGPWPMLAIAAGFLAKGPVVLVHTVAPALAAAAVARDFSYVRWFARPRWVALGLAVALPWYLIEAVRVPGLLPYWLGNQLWQRYATTVHHRAGPWHYFLDLIAAGALPWSLAAAAGLWAELKGMAVWKAPTAAAALTPSGAALATRAIPFERAALVAWLVIPVAFFSTAGSKLPGYILPELPVIALLAADALTWGTRWARVSGIALLALAVALESVAPRVLAQLMGAAPGSSVPLPPAAHAAALALALGGIACLLARPGWGAGLTLAAWIALMLAARPLDSAIGSPKSLTALLELDRAPGDPVVEVHAFVAGIPFYLGERVPMLEVPRELEFDSPEARSGTMLRREDLKALVEKRRRAWILAPAGHGPTMAQSLHLRFARVAEWRQKELGLLTPLE